MIIPDNIPTSSLIIILFSIWTVSLTFFDSELTYVQELGHHIVYLRNIPFLTGKLLNNDINITGNYDALWSENLNYNDTRRGNNVTSQNQVMIPDVTLRTNKGWEVYTELCPTYRVCILYVYIANQWIKRWLYGYRA